MLNFDKKIHPPRPLTKPEYYAFSYTTPSKHSNWSTEDYEGHIKRLYLQCDALLEYVKVLEAKLNSLERKS